MTTDHQVDSVVDPPALWGVGVAAAETAVDVGGTGIDGFTTEPLSDGSHLWDSVIGRACHIHAPIEGLLQELESEGGLCGARLKVLAELQSILRAAPAGIEPDEMLQVPAWHLTLLMRMAMERLG